MMDGTNNVYDLDKLVGTYNIGTIYEQYKRHEFIQKLSNYKLLNDTNVLEMGAADGQMTEILAGIAKEVVAVDGSGEFIRLAKERLKDASNVVFYESFFERFSIEKKFDVIIMHHILEHVENPVEVLKNIKPLIKQDGVVAISVPNAHALSRQLAVKMKLLHDVYVLTENDVNHGHYRVYDWKLLEEQLTSAGYAIKGRHGLSLKLFSDRQNCEMMAANIIGEPQIKGLWELADDYPAFSGAIMLVAGL